MSTLLSIVRRYVDEPCNRREITTEARSAVMQVTPYQLVMLKIMLGDSYCDSNIFNINFILCEIMRNDKDKYESIIKLQEIVV